MESMERRVIAPHHRYRTRSKAKNMEDTIKSLEQQNQELRGENQELKSEMIQIREQMNKLYELFTQKTAANVVPVQGTPTHPSGYMPQPYGMPYGWNANAENQKEFQRQEQAENSRIGQAKMTPKTTEHHHPPPDRSGAVTFPPDSEKLNSLEERLRAIEGTRSWGLDVTDLCLVPDVILLADFKTPKFEKYKGSTCPHIHLAMYCRKMASYIHQDKILVHCFQDSLTGAALSWYINLENGHVKIWRDLAEAFIHQYKYNEDMAHDRSRLQNLSKTELEGFKDYAQRWRELAVQVQPPLLKKEMVMMFIDNLPSPFYDKAVGSVATNFADLVIVGDRIESGIRRGKFAQTRSNTGFTEKMTGFEKKRGETNAILVHPSKATTSVDPAPTPKRENSSNTTNNRYGGRNRKNLIAVLPLKLLEPPYPRRYDPNAKYDYHARIVGHSTKRCWSFKHKVQDLIDVGWPRFEENEPNASPVELGEVAMLGRVESHLPAYKDDHVVPWQYDSYIEELPAESIDDNSAKEVTNIVEAGGMTRSDRIYSPETLKKKCSNPEKTIEAPKGKEIEEFLKLIRYSEYELLEQMNKTPARISLLSLLLNSEGHRNLLLKVLKEAHVAQDITIEKFGGMVNNIASKRCLTFSKEEVPKEGRRHNQPLHISVKCGEYMIAQVLIDNDSSLNILPKTTLEKLCSIDSQLRTNSVVVRAFDGSKREVIGEITLLIYVGPTMFNIVFQVMDIYLAYSCLLGRPGFTQQCDGRERIGDQYPPTPKEYIEGEEEALETSFQSLEIANS
ncbi:hypothetical protein CR513_02552, partial [Mucuna pruriens]